MLAQPHAQVLSLSHNSLRDLESFQHLVNLVELNVNFNAITTLHSLACPNLQRLYLSNNLIASTQRLKTFPKLRTICLFKNILSDLACALEPLRYVLCPGSDGHDQSYPRDRIAERGVTLPCSGGGNPRNLVSLSH